MAGQSLPHPVNVIAACQLVEGQILAADYRIQCTEFDALGRFLGTAYASELTVPHKTVAEPH
jgi:hypothetical protein